MGGGVEAINDGRIRLRKLATGETLEMKDGDSIWQLQQAR